MAPFAQTFAGQTMNLDLSKTVGRPRSITGLCTDLYLIVIRMREAEDLGAPEALRKLIKYYLDLFSKNCAAMSIADESVQEAIYALVALIDETVLGVPGACRDYWLSNPLQLEYFGQATAGEEFFRRLDKLLVQLEKKKDVAEVYYICLSLGFEGKYKLANAAERAAVIDDLGMRLRKLRGATQGPLSPHSYFAESESAGPGGKLPVVPLAAAAAALIAGIVYVALLVLSLAQAQRLAEMIH